MPELPSLPIEYYRWMAAAEHENWKQTGILKLTAGHTQGKYMTISAELAAAWGQLFRQKGWESEAGRIVKIVFSPEHARFVYYIGPKIDNIGPAYFAPAEILEYAEVTEVDA
jgi:hypothetical protein